MCLKTGFRHKLFKLAIAVAVVCIKLKLPFISAVIQYFLSYWT